MSDSDQIPGGPPLGMLLRFAHVRARKTFADALGPLDLQTAQYGVLLTLFMRGPQSQRQLIAAIHSDKSTMVRLIDDLERRGLVVRRPVAGDRRTNAVQLTDQGRVTFREAERIAKTVHEKLWADFSPEERRLFQSFLQRFIAAGDDG